MIPLEFKFYNVGAGLEQLGELVTADRAEAVPPEVWNIIWTDQFLWVLRLASLAL